MGRAPPHGSKSRRGAHKKQPDGPDTHAKRSNKSVSHTTHLTQQARPDIRAISDLTDNPSTEISDKLEQAKVLHARWIHEDAEGVVEGEELKHRQQSRCRDIGLVVFGVVLHEAQVEAIRTPFNEQQDLILIARTGF